MAYMEQNHPRQGVRGLSALCSSSLLAARPGQPAASSRCTLRCLDGGDQTNRDWIVELSVKIALRIFSTFSPPKEFP